MSAGGLFFDYKPWVAVGLGAVLFSAVLWAPLVRGITRSIAQMTHTTRQIAEGRFDARTREGRRDELGLLGQSINRMAARLAGFVTGQKRFLGDIAHELCSPLARIQVALGILEKEKNIRMTFLRWFGVGLTVGLITTSIVWVALLFLPLYR